MLGDALPDVDSFLLAFGALPEPGIARAVVDIRTGLPAGSGVHVDDDVEAGFLRPSDDAIEEGEAFFIAGSKEAVVDGDADGVVSDLGEELDVGAGDVAVPVFAPEFC